MVYRKSKRVVDDEEDSRNKRDLIRSELDSSDQLMLFEGLMPHKNYYVRLTVDSARQALFFGLDSYRVKTS